MENLLKMANKLKMSHKRANSIFWPKNSYCISSIANFLKNGRPVENDKLVENGKPAEK